MNCPQSGAESKPIQLRQSMLVEPDNKPGVWFINLVQYQGWIFDDNLDIPRWVWVLQGVSTVKPDIYPPYDGRWHQKGAKRMEEKDIGYLTKPMIDESTIMDDKQLLQLMEELYKLGHAAESAFLENRRAREQAQKETSSNNQGESMVCKGEGSKTGGGNSMEDNSTSSPKRKAESGDSAQSKHSEQDSKRASTEMGAKSGSSQGKAGQTQVMEIEEEGTGNPSQSGEAMDVSQQASSDLSTSMEASSASNPATQGEATSTQGQEKEVKGDSDDEDWEEEGEEEEEEPYTLIKWIWTVHNLQWERHIESEIRLAHHKHLCNLKQATTTEIGTASTNRFEILRREQELNEFYASQYGWKAQHHKNDITVQNAGYAQNVPAAKVEEI
ncbi:hypothetical protein CBR_g17715 [Chara braunii]|uniref:Uncharacterized protein n=1 Tax=Chara braunii TaxID=69332 RepID=A0A388KVB3_CHABU|nr:hypothetical protein CBR_g17715 [Chara braunii]|eukprot:GBG74005.1 hypothetical protein CBR_g17715 [Chara braunii]